MSKSARSGLSTVKRDWADQSSSPEEFYAWEPTQRPAEQRTHQQARGSSTTKPLTAREKRLKEIQEALAGHCSSQPPPPPLSESSQNKRGSPTDTPAIAPPEKRRRLPPGWDDALSIPSLSAQSMSSTSRSRASSSQTVVATPPESKKLPSVFLSQEQSRILKLVQNSESVFYTGSAGTGKSVLLREIIKTLRKQKAMDAVAITASTGIAACNIGGVTVHSFAGIGLGVGSAEELAVKVRRNKKVASRWVRTKVLIIDEVSMLDGELFDKLETISRTLRKKPEPFGGIQLIVTGDFFQLPPVARNVAVKFAFEADTWNQSIKHTFNLTRVFRQRDQTFVNMLNEMRFGNLSKESIAKFKSLSRAIEYDDGIGPTELFPRRDDVERSNENRMKTLKTDMQTYLSVDGGSMPESAQREKLLSNFMAPRKLELKVDAQVMLIKNVDETLVNGTMGRVLRFADPVTYGTEADSDVSGVIAASGQGGKKIPPGAAGIGAKAYPVVEFIIPQERKRRVLVMPEIWKVELPDGEVQVSRTQLPLILSWAMSIHKSQGQTLEKVKVDLGRVFEKGQAYVALSRATTLDGLQVLNFDPATVQAHPKVVAWSRTLSTIT